MGLGNNHFSVPVSIRAALQVFLGETDIKDIQSLKDFFKAQPESALRKLLRTRGNAMNYDRSKLQEAAELFQPPHAVQKQASQLDNSMEFNFDEM